MGTQDSYTDFHVDFGGTSVWYHIIWVSEKEERRRRREREGKREGVSEYILTHFRARKCFI